MRDFFDRKSSGGNRRTDSRGGYGGGSRFGSRGLGGGGYRGGDQGERTMHSTICSQCNTACEVPFKPNGRKPVLCQDCFRKDDGRDSAPRSSAQGFDRIGGLDKPAYKSTPHTGNEGIEKQLRVLNDKMDLIIEALSDTGEEESGDEDESEEGEE